MRSEPNPFFPNKKVTAKAIAIALAFSFVGTRQVVAGVTAGSLVLGPSLVNAFGFLNPISPALFGQTPPKNTPIFSSPAKPFPGASRLRKLLRTDLFYVKDPATGANNLQVANPNTGVVVTIDGKGNLLRINDPSKAPRAQSPPLNKANATRAGPQAQIEIKWNPLNGPGPLGLERASTFRGATYTEKVLNNDIVLYRAYGGKAGELGKYWSREKPTGPYQSAIDSAIKPEWGNTLEKVSTIRVPKGTRIYEGQAARQGGLVGGRNQIVIERVDPAWRIKE